MVSANAFHSDDPFDLGRFLSAQETVFEPALAEIKSGEKRTHWMWFLSVNRGLRIERDVEALCR